MSEEPIIHLRSIRGVGPSAESKIEACGIMTANELAAITIAEFKVRCPILNRKAAGFVKSAKTLVRQARANAGLPPLSQPSPKLKAEVNEPVEQKVEVSVAVDTSESPTPEVLPEATKKKKEKIEKKSAKKKKNKEDKKEKKEKKNKVKNAGAKEAEVKSKDKSKKHKKSKGDKKSKKS